MTLENTHLWAGDKTIFRSEFSYKGNKQTKKKNTNFQQNLAIFSAETASEHKIIQILHRKKKQQNFDRNVNVRTGTFL